MTRCTGEDHNRCLRGHFIKKSLFLTGFLTVITGCTTTPAVGPPVFIHDKTYLPIPSTLTMPVTVDLTQATWGSAVGDLKAGLESCDGKLDAIRALTPPP